MKKILLPTDFSENARHSMEYAANLFANEPVEFIIINTYDPPPTPAQLKSKKLSETIEADSKADLEKEKIFLSAKVKNDESRITCIYRKGALSNVLTNVGKKNKADLIIMSPRGENQSLGFGSNTVAVMNSSDIPVLVVSKKQEFHPIKDVLFAADLQGYSKKALDYPLKYFVENFDSDVRVVHFGTEENEEKNQIMGELVEKFGDDRTHVQYIQEESVVEGINKVVMTYKPDLLVLVNRHRWFFSQIFLKTVTQQVVLDDSVPILILHDKN